MLDDLADNSLYFLNLTSNERLAIHLWLVLSLFIFDNHKILLNSIRMRLNMGTTEKWMSVGEIAEHLGVAAITIYRWLERGHIPAHRVGRQWRFNQSEIDKWVKSGNASEDAAEQVNANTFSELRNTSC